MARRKTSELDKSIKVELSGGKLVDKQEKSDIKPVSKFYDPLYVLDYLQYKTKNTSWALSYHLLRKISYRNGVIASIINTRINQVSLFAHPYLTPNDRIGYSIYPRSKKFQNIQKQIDPNFRPPPMSQAEFKKAMELSDTIEKCGTVESLVDDPLRDDFAGFLKKIVRDSLTFDQACFEIVKSPKSGVPMAFYPVDSGTIRLSDPRTRKDKGIYYVQYIDGNLYTAYNYDEMAFAIRNPTTDIKANGYGVSEIEMALNYVSSVIYGEEYNKKFFTQGSSPKGILNIRGTNIPQEELDAFRRSWHAQLTGVNNAWKTPILASEGVEWVGLGQSNREMEFGRWLEYLVNIICAIFQIDPVEINFPNKGGVSGQSRSLTDSSTLERIKFSKDKGLVPLLKFLEGYINKYIIYPISDSEFEFSFVGYTDLIDQQKVALERQESEYLKTVNEIRAQYGLKEIDGGDIILNPVFSQFKMQLDQQRAEQEATQQQGGAEQGGPDESQLNEAYEEGASEYGEGYNEGY